MKETITKVTKLAVRGLMAVGALLGFTSCPNRPAECVYGPPPGVDTLGRVMQDSIEMIEDVYGPPVEEVIDTPIVDEQVAEPEPER